MSVSRGGDGNRRTFRSRCASRRALTDFHGPARNARYTRRVDDRARDPDGPVSRPRGRLSSRPAEERATPVAEASVDYRAYIDASGTSKAEARATVRFQAEDLDRLREQSKRTGSTKRPRDLADVVDRVAREPRGAPRPRGRVLPLVGGLAALAAGALWLLLPRARPAPSTLAPSAQPTAQSTAAPAPSTPAALPPDASPIPVAESQARAALERLRSGLGECIRHGIHGLPGSSSAVPSTIGALRGGTYTAMPGEWKTPVWWCAHFQMHEEMRFQLQWQLLKPGVDGLAIAWIDGDEDGVADRALGFHITLSARGEPVLGDIGPVPASQAVVVVR